LGSGDPYRETSIIGVVKDFNFKSLREEIEPMTMVLAPQYITAISLKIEPGEIITTLDLIKKKWQNIFPGEFYTQMFLEDQIEQLYDNEKKMQSILMVFSSLSILVACLGLFGLAAYTVEDKTKEIGIRKTLGASIPRILVLLTKEFVKWVTISIFIAFPISYYLMDNWLQNFAYHINLGLAPFILAAIVSLMISIITVSIQVVKAALKNPIDTLRYE